MMKIDMNFLINIIILVSTSLITRLIWDVEGLNFLQSFFGTLTIGVGCFVYRK
jgi:hypothetical protein